MKIADATIDIRPRSQTEVLDLALLFYRKHVVSIGLLTAIFGVPGIVVATAIHHLSGHMWMALIFFWLFLLLPGGAIVLFAGRCVFGTRLTIRGVLSLYRSVWKSYFFSRLLQKCLCLVLSPIVYGYVLYLGTGFSPMICLLERLSGKGADSRNRSLLRSAEGITFFFDLLLLLVVAVATVAGMQLVQLMLGEVFTLWPETGLFSRELASDPVRLGIWMLMVLLVYPVVPLAWLFRYIDARIRGEGWDLELEFRKAAARLRNLHLTSITLLLVLLFPAAAHCGAKQADKSVPSNSRVEKDLDEITKESKFNWLREGGNRSEATSEAQVVEGAESSRQRKFQDKESCGFLPQQGDPLHNGSGGDGCSLDPGAIGDGADDDGCGGNTSRSPGCGCNPSMGDCGCAPDIGNCGGIPGLGNCGSCAAPGAHTLSLVGYILAAIALVAVVVIVLRTMLLRPVSRKDAAVSRAADIDDPLDVRISSVGQFSPGDLLNMGRSAAQFREFRKAVGFAYLCGISSVHQEGFVVLDKAMTNLRIATAVKTKNGPWFEIQSLFGEFEEVFFGDREATDTRWRVCEALAEGVLSRTSRVEEEVDNGNG